MTERMTVDGAEGPPRQWTSLADRPSAIGSCLALATVGFVTSMGMPMLVAALIEQYRYSEGQAGYVASTEYLGMFAASILVSSLILRVSRRKLATAGLLIAVLSNAVSLLVTTLPNLLAMRFLSGLGCGTAYAVAVAVLAGTNQTVRNFMFLVFANAVTNVLVLYSFPTVLKYWPSRAYSLSTVGCSSSPRFAYRGCPESSRQFTTQSRKAARRHPTRHHDMSRGSVSLPYSASI